MLAILAVAGVLVLGLGAAVATGLVDVSSFDPFSKLNANAARPATGPIIDEDQPVLEMPSESEASQAALTHAGYEDRMVFLSAAEAKVAGPRISLENRGSSSYYSSRRASSRVDEKNRLPSALIRGWTTSADSAEWTFESPQAGNYVLTFDCVTGSSSRTERFISGDFTITVGNEKLDARVNVDISGRKGSTAYHLIDVGQIALPAGKATLRISPTSTEKVSDLLLLRSIRLYPSE